MACGRSRVKFIPPFFPPRILIVFRLSYYVALKIATSESDYAGQELKILRHISTELQQHPGKNCIMTLLDSFEHRGPNGIHECFVFEVMGSSLEGYIMDSMLKIAHPNRPSIGPQKQFEYNLPEIRSILRQILYGIDFLHKCGIAHSDLQPGNVLVSIRDLSSIEESHLAQYDENGVHFVTVADSGLNRFVRTYKDNRPSVVAESKSPRTKRQKISRSAENRSSAQENLSSLDVDSQGMPEELNQPLQEDHKPRYLALKRPLDDVIELTSPIRVKVCDMGGAFFLSSPPEKPITPLNMRSPELVLGHPISQNQDIWSFGCLVFELITSKPLFTVYPLDFFKMMDSSEDEDYCTENEGDEKDVIGHENEKKFQTDREGDRGSDTEQQEGDTKKKGKERRNPAIPHSEEDEDDLSPEDDHLQQFACVLRPLPPSILSQWPKASNFCDQKGEAKYDKGDDVPPWQSMEELFDYDKPVDVNATERVAVLDLIRHILQYEPQKRPSASQLLKHPWFAEADF